MTAIYEIPLTPLAQKFSIDLAGVTYNLSLRWNSISTNWVLDVYSSLGSPLLLGIPLVTGVDLFKQFTYLDFGGGLVAVTDSDSDAVPTLENLGTASHLYFFTV